MALTLDDYPLAESSAKNGAKSAELWTALHDALRTRAVPATWFVVAGALDAEAGRFLDRVDDVGNHTAHHLALTDVTADEFLRDVDEADEVLARWMRAPKLFRHPYLREGDTPAKQRLVCDGLRARGYVNAPVTIAPRDWEVDAQPFRDELLHRYIGDVEDEARCACERARERVGREIPHVLVLHVNALNAAALGPLLDRLARTWRFVPLRDALADPVYRRAVPPSDIGLTLLEAI